MPETTSLLSVSRVSVCVQSLKNLSLACVRLCVVRVRDGRAIWSRPSWTPLLWGTDYSLSGLREETVLRRQHSTSEVYAARLGIEKNPRFRRPRYDGKDRARRNVQHVFFDSSELLSEIVPFVAVSYLRGLSTREIRSRMAPIRHNRTLPALRFVAKAHKQKRRKRRPAFSLKGTPPPFSRGRPRYPRQKFPCLSFS